MQRRLSFLILSPLLTLSIGGFILTTALHQTIGQPKQTEDLVQQSGLYQAIIPSQLAQVQKDNPSVSGIPLDNPQVQKALADSVNTKQIEGEGNQVIDTLYRWLNGNDTRPTFSINAMPDRQTLATELGQVAYQHAADLPACTSLSEVPTDIATNPLAAKCLPPGLSAEAVRQLVIGQVDTSDVLASTDATITQDDIKGPNGKPILDSFSSAPTWYKPLLALPKIFAIAAAVCALLLLVTLRPTRGIKSIGKHMLTVGITLGILALFVTWAVDWAFKRFVPQSSDADVNGALMKLVSLFDTALRNNIVRLSMYAVAAGAVLFAIGWALRRAAHHSSTGPKPAQSKHRSSAADRLEAPAPQASFTPAGPPALPKTAHATKAHRKRAATHSKKESAKSLPTHRTKKKK